MRATIKLINQIRQKTRGERRALAHAHAHAHTHTHAQDQDMAWLVDHENESCDGVRSCGGRAVAGVAKEAPQMPVDSWDDCIQYCSGRSEVARDHGTKANADVGNAILSTTANNGSK